MAAETGSTILFSIRKQVDMNTGYMVERITLWDMLCEPSLTLQLSRFALFLLIAIITLAVLDCRKLSISCSFSTVMLLLTTGLIGIYAYYCLLTSFIYVNTWMYIQPWYYPICILTITALTAAFICGGIGLVRKGRTKNMIVRSLIYGFALYFAFTAVFTPTKTNMIMARSERPEDAAVPEDVVQIDFRDTLLPFFFHGF